MSGRAPLIDDRNDNGVGCWPQRTYGGLRVGTCSDVCYDPAAPGFNHGIDEDTFYAPDTTVAVSLSPSSASVGPGDFTDLTVTVTSNGAALVGASVVATSSDVTKAIANPVTVTNAAAHSGWGLGAVTYSDPSVTTPLGHPAYRFTETAVASWHGIQPTGMPRTAIGTQYRFVAEIRNSAAPTTRDKLVIETGDQGFTNSQAYWQEDGTGWITNQHDSVATYAIGSGWIRYETVETANASAAATPAIFGYDETGATSAYLGVVTNFHDIARFWVEQLSAVTNASGQATIRVRGVAVGSANITVTVDTVTSSASAITVGTSQTLTATRFTNASTFRNHTLVQAAGAQTLTPTRFTDGDTFGTHALRARATLVQQRVVDADSWGNHALRAITRLSQQRVVDADTFGNASLRARITLPATRLANTSTLGNAALRARYTLAAQPVVNASAFGNQTLVTAANALIAQRVVNASTFGNPSLLRGDVTLGQQRVVNGSTFGNATLVQPAAPQTLVASRIVNASSFGGHTLIGGEAGGQAPTVEKTRGPGGIKPRRRYLRVWDGERWVEVHSAEAAQALIEQVEAKAAQDAQEAAQRLAERPKVRMRAARRAAPVVRIEAPQEDVAAIQRRVEEVNARLRQMYENALRAEMIGRLIQKRLEEDEDEAILALLD